MANYSFPMYIEEIEIGSVSSIRFTLPANDVGRADVKIIVEYGNDVQDPQKIILSVWCWIGGSTIRGFLCNEVIQTNADEDKQISDIICCLNGSEAFNGALFSFIRWHETFYEK